MTIIHEKTSGSFNVKLTEHEVDERRKKLVTHHVRLQELIDLENAAKANLKNRKENTEAHRNEMEDLARVCRTGEETQFLDDAPVEIDTTRWLRTVLHPTDFRVVAERALTPAERENYRQMEIETPEEREATEAAAARSRKRKAPGTNGEDAGSAE